MVQFTPTLFVFRKLKRNQVFISLILCAIGGVIAAIPAPSGVAPQAYPMFGIFVALVLGILLKPYPITTLSLFGFFVAIVCNLITIEEGCACFGETVIWFIALASIAAQSFVKTNLGRRIACIFIKQTGTHSLSLAYGLMLSECAFAPMIPSNTARAVCLSVPLAVSISEALGSSPKDKTEKVIGQFLNLCNMHANQISSTLFLTAMACNSMVQKFMANIGITITWCEWFLMALVPGLVCVLLSPWLIYKLAPPKLKEIPQAKVIAQKQLDAMPPIDKNEIKTICVFCAMLLFWVIGSFFKIPTALVALGGLCVLLATGVLDVDDITGAKEVWSIVIWLSIFTLLAWKLTEFGLIDYYSAMLKAALHECSWPIVLIIVSAIYYLGRYILPGNTIHACAMFPAFAQLLIACGVPAKVGCMVLAFITAYCGYVTPYATSPCPIIFNTGYIDLKLWWKIGVITGFFYFFIWIFVGGAWWKVLGYL